SWRDYLRVKFWRSYWRMDVYKHYPKKIFSDSYTPQTMKLQILAIAMAAFSLLLLYMIPYALYLLYFSLLVLVIFTVPLTIRAFRRGIVEGLMMPWFIIGRAVSLGLGVFYYALEIKNIRTLVAFIILSIIIVVPSLFSGGLDLFARALVFVLAFPFLFFVWRADDETAKVRIPRRYNILLPLLVFTGLMLVSVFLSVSAYDSYYSLIHWLTYLVIFLGVFYLVNSFYSAQKFAYLLIFLAVCLALVGLYFFIQTENYQYLRVISTFYQHNPFAGFLLVPLALSYAYTFYLEGRKRKLILVLITILLSLTFVLTHSRGAWLSFLVPLLIILIFAIRRRQHQFKPIMVTLVIAAMVAAGWWGITQLKESQAESAAAEMVSGEKVISYSQETADENAVNARLNFWGGARDIFLDYPILGSGLGTYKTMYREYLRDIRYYSIDPHNIYLKVLSEMGIVGAAAFYWFIAAVLLVITAGFRFISKLESDSDKALFLGLGTGLLGILMHNFVELDWVFPSNMIIFFVALAVFFKLFLIKQNSGQDDKVHSKTLYSRSFQTTAMIVAFVILIAGALVFISGTWQEKGEYYLAEAEWKNAETQFSSAVALDPLNYDLRGQLALTYAYLIPNDIDYYRPLHVAELEKTIDLNKHNYNSYEMLGRYYMITNNTEKAIENFKQAISLNPISQPKLYTLLATVYKVQERYGEIIDLLEGVAGNYNPELADSVIWVIPDKRPVLNSMADIHVILAQAYQATDKPAEAEQNYAQALEYNPDNETAQNELKKGDE
ncbi:MAG: O-antigen ligase family protein, partial [Patescibacteria group bacterium]